jgi:glycine hydroxymethyltransferase
MDAHDAWMTTVVSLIASENLLSPLAIRALASDLGNRVAEGGLGERLFPGLRFYDDIEKVGIRLVRELFNAPFADLRPISGTMANMAVFSAATRPGDAVVAIPVPSGGHVSMSGSTPKDLFHLDVIDLPVRDDLSINVPDAEACIAVTRPALVVLGGSVILAPQPVREIVAIAHSVGAKVLFDASHVAGLIAGGTFPNPLSEGADFMTFSTCKTIPGPQHAVVTAQQEHSAALKSALFPRLQSGHHLADTVAAIVTLAELKAFGVAYARQVTANAAALSDAMVREGFEVIGDTATHMVLTRHRPDGAAGLAQNQLEAANILVNANLLPNDRSFRMPSGLRLGVQEVARLGMKEQQMSQIAEWISRVVRDGESPACLKASVAALRHAFPTPRFCYEGTP